MLTYEPVDYDPFKKKTARLEYTPVEQDPFAGEVAAQPSDFIMALGGTPREPIRTPPGVSEVAVGGGQTPSPGDIPVDVGLKTAANEYSRQFGNVIANIPKYFGIQKGEIYQQMLDGLNEIDKEKANGTYKPAGIIGSELLDEYGTTTDPKKREAIRRSIEDKAGNPQQTPPYKIGPDISDWFTKHTHVDPKAEESFVYGQLPQGIGSTLGFMLGTILTRGKGSAAMMTAGLGAANQSVQSFEDALQHNASIKDAYQSSDLGAIIGTSEALPITDILDRVDKFSGGAIKKTIINVLKSGTEEGLQEGFQQIASNLIASKIVKYDPQRDTWSGVGNNAGVGFTTGALLHLLGSLVGVKLHARDLKTLTNNLVDESKLGNAEQQAVDALSPKGGVKLTPVQGNPFATDQVAASMQQGVSKGEFRQDLQPSDQADYQSVKPNTTAKASGIAPPTQPVPDLAPQTVRQPGTRKGSVLTGTGGKAVAPDLPAIQPGMNDIHAAKNLEYTPVEHDPFQGTDHVTQPALEMASRAAQQPGTRYEGMLNDRELPGSEAGSIKNLNKPITREDVLIPLLKALNVPLYQGRVKGKRLGFYLPQREAVRIKNKSDLEVAAHELAHLMDDRIPAIHESWTRGKDASLFSQELKGISYDKTKVYEGFAEFVRLYMTQQKKAQEAAPNYYRWFTSFMETHEYGPAIQKARDDMHAWFQQDALARAASKIGPQKELNGVLDGLFDQFRQSVADDFHGIYRMEKDLTGKISPKGPYEVARLTRAAYSIVEGALTIGKPVVKPDGSHAFVGKGLQQILDPVADQLDDWALYAVGRSARELAEQGREKLFTRAEIDAMTQLETPAFKQAFDEYQKWNKAVVDFAEAKGLINPETRKLWQRTQYLPFFRAEQSAPVKRKGGIEGNWQGIHKLTGGTGNIRDVLGNMIQNASHLLTEALRNEARVDVADMAEQLRGGGRFMVKIPKDTRSLSVDKEQVRGFVYKMLGLNPSTSDVEALPPEMQRAVHQLEQQLSQQPDYLQFWMHGQDPKGSNVIAVMRKGKPDFYEVADPLLYRSFAMFSRPAKHWLVKILNQVRRVGQSSVTLSLDFMAANFARDTLMSGVMSRYGFKPFLDSLRGMKSRITRDGAYKQFIANGGGFASYLVDESAFKKHLERFYTEKGLSYRTVLDVPSKILSALESIGDAFEMSARLGEFRRALKHGEHPRHAAYSAREVSTDYAMRGDSKTLGFLYDSVMFLKAGVNGLDRAYRGIAHDPNRARIAVKTGVLALVSMALYMLNRDNPLYDQMEDWDKDMYWHFFIPNEKYYQFVQQYGREPATPAEAESLYHHYRYPKIWEIGAVSSVAERSMEQLLNGLQHGTADMQQYFVDVTRVLGNMFMFDYVPQAIAPLYEQALNRNRFTGRPIENQALQQLAPFARSGPYTSSTLRELGMATRDFPRALQIPPARAEALLRGYFNTWAMYGLTLTDQMLFDDKPDMRVDQYPVLRRFYSAAPAKHTRFETEFYEMLREATELRRTMRMMDKTWRTGIANELEKAPGQAAYGQLNRANKRLQAINREIRQTYRLPMEELQAAVKERLSHRSDEMNRLITSGTVTDPGKLKRWLIDDLTREKNQLLWNVMQDVNAQ